MTDLMLPLAEFEANPDRYILIDVRDEVEFAERHIPGAINVPLGRLRSEVPDIPAGSAPVTVCGKGGGRSAEAAVILRSMGLSACGWKAERTTGWMQTPPCRRTNPAVTAKADLRRR